MKQGAVFRHSRLAQRAKCSQVVASRRSRRVVVAVVTRQSRNQNQNQKKTRASLSFLSSNTLET